MTLSARCICFWHMSRRLGHANRWLALAPAPAYPRIHPLTAKASMHSRISDDITFRKLEVLLAYMEGGNLNAAARRLDISAVSVHRALHSLEEAMSCQLFSLQGRNLIPNEAAQVLADVSRDVIQLMADGIAATRSAAGYSADHLKIGSLYSLTTGTIPNVIIGIKLRKQELETELVLGSNADLLHKLKQNAIDAALIAVPDPIRTSNRSRCSRMRCFSPRRPIHPMRPCPKSTWPGAPARSSSACATASSPSRASRKPSGSPASRRPSLPA